MTSSDKPMRNPVELGRLLDKPLTIYVGAGGQFYVYRGTTDLGPTLGPVKLVAERGTPDKIELTLVGTGGIVWIDERRDPERAAAFRASLDSPTLMTRGDD